MYKETTVQLAQIRIVYTWEKCALHLAQGEFTPFRDTLHSFSYYCSLGPAQISYVQHSNVHSDHVHSVRKKVVYTQPSYTRDYGTEV